MVRLTKRKTGRPKKAIPPTAAREEASGEAFSQQTDSCAKIESSSKGKSISLTDDAPLPKLIVNENNVSSKRVAMEPTSILPPPSAPPRVSRRLASATAKESMSPNQNTRANRLMRGVDVENSHLEQQRVIHISLQFAKNKYKPCTVFGPNRQQRYKDYFFCGNCDHADDSERAQPNRKLNRVTGIYACRAKHTMLIHPTDKLNPAELRKQIQKARNKQVDSTSTSPPSPKKKKTNKAPPPPFAGLPTAKEQPSALSTPPSTCTEKDPESPRARAGEQHQSPTTKNKISHSHHDASPQQHDASVKATPTGGTSVREPSMEALESETRFFKQRVRDLEITVSTLEEQLAEAKKENEMLRIERTNSEVNLRRKTSLLSYYQVNKKQDAVVTAANEYPQGKLPKSCLAKADAMVIVNHIREIIVCCTKGMQATSRGARWFFDKLGELMLDDSVHFGLLKETVYEHFRKYYRKYKLPVHKLMRGMDIRGGPLNYSCIEMIRSIESDGEPHARTMLPSTSELQFVCSVVESYGQRLICPFKMSINTETGGEQMFFRGADMLLCTIIAGGHWEAAFERSIELSWSLDGALFSNNLSHTLIGVKNNDRDTVLRQSRDNVFPSGCTLSRETKALVRGTLSKAILELHEASETVLPSRFPGMKPIILSTNCDMSAGQKLTGRGGATGIKRFPCHCCATQTGELHIGSSATDQCKWCIQLGYCTDPSRLCFHKYMLTDEKISELYEEVERLGVDMPLIIANLTEIRDATELRTDEDPRTATALSKSDPKSVHYNWRDSTPSQRQAYSRLVNKDLRLRHREVTGSLEERHMRIACSLIAEWTYLRASLGVEYDKSHAAAALVLLINTVPCILHMENRVSLKILKMLLEKGLTNAKGNDEGSYLDWIGDDVKGLDRRIQLFLSKVQEVVNTKILGSVDNKHQWEVPYENDKRRIGAICMTNVRVRRVVDSLDDLVDLCIVDELDATRWKQCVAKYRSAMVKVRTRHDMSDEEIMSFQSDADDFFHGWMVLHQEEGITNYIHMLGAGHIAEYLFHWRCLYTHSQQGWEAFNALFKLFYFRRTQRGGSTGRGGTGKRSRLKPIARWLQRRILWMMNIDYDTMATDYKNPKVTDDEDWVLANGGSVVFAEEQGVVDDENIGVTDEWDAGADDDDELYGEDGGRSDSDSEGGNDSYDE